MNILASEWASHACWGCRTGWFVGTGLGCDRGLRRIAEEGGEPGHTEREPAVPDTAVRHVHMCMAVGMGSGLSPVPETS